MKVTFPHMGHMWICLKAMLQYLGVEVVVPPSCSKKTLTLGTKHAPEFACMPLKLNLGNFMEAYELGADTIIMAGGCGPCRFGYYAYSENEILKDLKYNFNLIVLEPPEKHFSEFLIKIKQITGNRSWYQVIKGIRFGFLKAKAVDEIERLSFKIRPRELVAGSTDMAFQQALAEIDRAKTPQELIINIEQAKNIMSSIEIDQIKPVLKVGIVGEIYTLLEPFSNQNIERLLGKLGVEVDRSIYLSEWINDHLFMGLIKKMSNREETCRAARPFLNHFVGGHGEETIGSTVLYSEKGYDGVIQLLPFTCMPEIVAQSILPKVSEKLGIAVMTLIVDEQSGEAGLLTRLEAFVDLIAQKKKQKEALA
ncbi:CoA protein activase [Desulfolucanica intricata]|uniref:CoA protein activase n=1 Tax=Desulfolucanica intricata TaxID=1285191 RepID=UPI00082C5FC3|nr:CoA protein activase [Desulfolucanica intricata]